MAALDGVLADLAAQVTVLDDLLDTLQDQFGEAVADIRTAIASISDELDNHLEVDDDGSL